MSLIREVIISTLTLFFALSAVLKMLLLSWHDWASIPVVFVSADGSGLSRRNNATPRSNRGNFAGDVLFS
jgi:hypothetical protein